MVLPRRGSTARGTPWSSFHSCRDAGHLELARRLAEERIRRDRHRCARVVDDELRHVDLERALDDEGDRPGRHHVRCEVVPVHPRAGDAEEEGSGRHAARVVCEVGDLGVPACHHLPGRKHPDHRVEIHESRL